MREPSTNAVRLTALSLVILAATGHAQAPQSPLQRPLHPIGAIGWSCEIYPELEAAPRSGGRELQLTFFLANDGARARTVTLRTRCPGGPVTIHGLPTGSDPMHTCQAGACIQPTSSMQVVIPPRGRAALGETLLRAQGDACNPALPKAPLTLSLSVEGEVAEALLCQRPPLQIPWDAKAGRFLKPATPVVKKPPSPKPTPQPKYVENPRAPQRQCPACGIGCPHGVPAQGLGPDGCPKCACEDFDLSPPRTQ